MNVTKFLCKYFDEKNKGYVTLWDIISNGFWYLIGILIISIGLYAPYKIQITYGLLRILTPSNPYPEWVVWWDYGFAFIVFIEAVVFVFATIILILLGIGWVHDKLKSVKVVECKLQKEDKIPQEIEDMFEEE